MAEGEINPEDKTIPFFPDHITTEAKVALGILVLTVIVGIIGLFMPVGLESPADPMVTPAHTKPEWYFLFLFQLLKYIPKTLGVLIPTVALIVLMVWPFIDNKQDTRKAVRFRWILTAIGMLFIITLTVLGWIS